MRRSGKGSKGAMISVILVVGIVAFAGFVPVRDCKKCLGIRGFQVGNLDLRCKGCGGDGKQTLLEIGLEKVR